MSDALEHRYGELSIETDFGWAVRYRARVKDVDLHIAVFKPEAGRLESARRDAAKLERLKNPHVAALRDVLELDDGRLVLELEAPVGPTLAQRVLEGSSKVGELVDRICQVADGLRALHEAGIVHGDLEPENVVVTEARGATILGLVLNHALDRESRGTSTNDKRVLRSLAYMAPEQARGERATKASDIYSLGAIAYSAIAGRRPYTQDEAAELRRAIAAAGAPHLSEVRSEVRGALAYAVDRAMAREPSRRFPDAEAMRKALRSSLVVAPKLATLELAARFAPKDPDPPPKVTGRGSYRPPAPGESTPGSITAAGFPAPALGGDHGDAAPVELVRLAPTRNRRGSTLLGLKIPEAEEKRFRPPPRDDAPKNLFSETQPAARESLPEIDPDALEASTMLDSIPKAPAIPSELLHDEEPLEQEPTQVSPPREEHASNGKDHKPVTATRSGAGSAKPSDGEWGPSESHSTGRGGAAPSEKAVPVPKQSIGRVDLVRKSNEPGKPVIEEPLSKPKIEVARDEAISKPKIELPKTDEISKPKIELAKTDEISKPKIEVARDEAISKPKIELPKTDEISKPKIELKRDEPGSKPKIEVPSESLSKPKIEVSKPPPSPPAKADTGVKRAPREPSTIELTDDTLEELNISDVGLTPPPVPAPALELDPDDDSERLSLHDMEPLRPSQAERLDTKQLTSPPPPPDRDSDPMPRGTDTWHVRKPKSSSKTWIVVAAAAAVLFGVGLAVGRFLEGDEAIASAGPERPTATSLPPDETALPTGLDTPELPEEPARAEAPEPEAEPPPEPTELRLVGLPENAEVLLNRAPVRGTTVVLPPTHTPHVLEFRGIEPPPREAEVEEPAPEETRAERRRAERRRAERTPRMRERRTRRAEQPSAMEAPAVASTTERRRPTVVVDPGF